MNRYEVTASTSVEVVAHDEDHAIRLALDYIGTYGVEADTYETTIIEENVEENDNVE